MSLNDFKHLVSWNEYVYFDSTVRKKVIAFCVGTPEGFVPPEGMDFNKLSIEWFFNHSCDGNLGFNEKGDFMAVRNVKKGEELSYDYGLIESNPKFQMSCECQSKNCRKRISDDDWQLLIKDENKSKYIHPFLKSILKKTGGKKSI